MNSGSDLGKDKSHWISRHLPLPESCSHYRHPLPPPRPRSTAKQRDLPHWRRPGFQLPVWFSIKADMSCQAWSLLWRLVRYLLLWLFYRGPRWPPKGYLLVPSTHLPNLEGSSGGTVSYFTVPLKFSEWFPQGCALYGHRSNTSCSHYAFLADHLATASESVKTET